MVVRPREYRLNREMQMPTLAGVLATTARRTPNRLALKFGSRTHTYVELDARVNQLARVLAARGLAKGDRVLVISGNSDNFVIAVYAGLRLGAIVVPVNPRSAPPELDYLVRDSGSRILLFGPEVEATIRAWEALPDHDGEAAAWSLGAAAGYQDILEIAATNRPDPVEVDVFEDDDALIIYTSGTTGRPKGALFDHHRVIWVGQNTSMGIGTLDGERFLHAAPLYHSAALNMLLLHGVMLGATHVILPAFDPEVVLEANVPPFSSGCRPCTPSCSAPLQSERGTSRVCAPACTAPPPCRRPLPGPCWRRFPARAWSRPVAKPKVGREVLS